MQYEKRTRESRGFAERAEKATTFLGVYLYIFRVDIDVIQQIWCTRHHNTTHRRPRLPLHCTILFANRPHSMFCIIVNKNISLPNVRLNMPYLYFNGTCTIILYAVSNAFAHIIVHYTIISIFIYLYFWLQNRGTK